MTKKTRQAIGLDKVFPLVFFRFFLPCDTNIVYTNVKGTKTFKAVMKIRTLKNIRIHSISLRGVHEYNIICHKSSTFLGT